MNENQNAEVHYMDPNYPYTAVPGNYEAFYGGIAPVPSYYVHPGQFHDQEAAYWSSNVNVDSYRYGLSGSESTSYHGFYEVNDHMPSMDYSRAAWGYPSVTYIEEPAMVDVPSEENADPTMHAIPEECSPEHQDGANSQVIWQDDIDPDNMSYEELLDLGEAVGTESRGLSEELINMLPTSKHKSCGIFSRRKSGERCVICQMQYKRGDRQINLPCKHVYHADCGSKWLRINKTCPVCNSEVFGDQSRH